MATKTKREDAHQTGRKATGMDPALFEELLQSVRDGGKYLRGELKIPAERRHRLAGAPKVAKSAKAFSPNWSESVSSGTIVV